MKLGFTGTRQGMSVEQKIALEEYLSAYYVTELHHGDCLGADKEAHDIADNMGIRTISHPPKYPSQRAFCIASVVLQEKEYLERNHDIVDATDCLFAAPAGKEIRRSGTWATIRYARNKSTKDVIIAERN